MSVRGVSGSVAALSILVLAAPGVAEAHLRLGTVAVGVRVVVNPSGWRGVFSVSVSQGERSLRLRVRPGHRVVVLGYLGEPMVRVDARGTAVNVGSPTAAAAGLLGKKVVGASSLDWVLEHSASAVWRDPRIQRLPNDVRELTWTIPVRVDGRPARISGRLSRVPPPSLWSWLAVACAPLVGVLAWQRRRRNRYLAAGCVLFSCVAAALGIVAAASFAVEGHASGSAVAAVYELVFAVGGVGFMVWGPAEVRIAAAGWLGLVGLTAGLAFGQVFLYGAVLSALPAAVTRAAAAGAIGTGAAGVLLAGLFYSRREPSAARGNSSGGLLLDAGLVRKNGRENSI